MVKRKTIVLLGLMAIVIFLSLAFHMNVSSQDNYYLLPECPIPENNQRVLIFSPHPDDETLAVGGYIYSAEQAGAGVRIVLVTDGNRHGLREKRYQEFIAATGLLQLKSDEREFWGYPDGRLPSFMSELQSQVSKEIDDFRPDYVIYPSTRDTHPDHAALGRAVEQELGGTAETGRNIAAFAYLVHFKYYPEPQVLTRKHFLMPPLALTMQNGVWYRLSLSPQAEQAKRQALKAYRTQQYNPFLKPLFMTMMRHNELLVSRSAF